MVLKIPLFQREFLIVKMDEDIEDVKKLSPEERLKRLKEIEKKEEDELENIRSLIKNSEGEIEVEDEKKRRFPIPQLRSVDTSPLFGKRTEERRLVATHHFEKLPDREESDEESLEGIAQKVPEQQSQEEKTQQGEQGYSVQESFLADYSGKRANTIRYMPTEVVHDKVYNIAKSLKYQSVSEQQMEDMLSEIELTLAGTEMKISDITHGKYIPSEEISYAVDLTHRIARDLLDRYR